jgi:Xaa-Pro aminopeptidase
VLRAHIAVDTAVFPAGTTGYQLDAVARMPLWQAGLDYRHGRFAAAHTRPKARKPESPSPTPRAANKTDPAQRRAVGPEGSAAAPADRPAAWW